MNINIIIPWYDTDKKDATTFDTEDDWIAFENEHYSTFKNLIFSLVNQDYDDFDVTVVLDGPDSAFKAFLLKSYYDDNGSCTLPFKLYIEELDENKGASEARNFGAKISGLNLETKNHHNILFFVDADCYIYPSILREIADQFELNKQIDFIYGNYRFENKHNYMSVPFDPYRLETMNFISTMSPVRRKAFNKVGGFKTADYFQDWSLFYRLAKAGAKGLYLNEFFFSTKFPTEKSISGSKGLTLGEKASEFRRLHKIKDKELVVTSYGADHQALQRAKMLNADFVSHPQQDMKVMPNHYDFKNWKGTYMVGCYNENADALASHFSATVGRPIMHFIGTDTFHLMNNHSMTALKDFVNVFKEQNTAVFANSERGLLELHDCGFTMAKLLYTPIYNMAQYQWKINPPQKFTVGVYFSDTNPMMQLESQFSNLKLVLEVAKAMPTMKFKFFGGKMKYKAKDVEKKMPENVEFCGRIKEEDMVDFINSCSMIVRSTIHDGFPQLPIQFMLCGRQALVSCPEATMRYAEKLSHEEIYNTYDSAKEEMIEKIYAMSENPDALKDKVSQIHEYYSGLMNEDHFRKEIYACLS